MQPPTDYSWDIAVFYLHALQYGSTFLLQDSVWVLNRLSGSPPDVAHPDGHPGYTRLTRLVVLLEGGGRWGQREEETSECNLKCFYKTKYLCLLSFLTEQRGQPTVDRRLWYFVTNMILSTKNEHAWCMSFIKSYKSTLMSHECAYNALQTWCW